MYFRTPGTVLCAILAAQPVKFETLKWKIFCQPVHTQLSIDKYNQYIFYSHENIGNVKILILYGYLSSITNQSINQSLHHL